MPKIAVQIWSHVPKGIVFILIIICAIGVLRAALTIPEHVPLDPNEGWNAYHALAAMAGNGLYPPAKSLMINNYPPLSFYLVGMLGHATGDMIVAGRLISLAAFLALLAGIAFATRSMGCTLLQSMLATFLFADALLLFSNYVAMDDPQILGHAIDIAGFVLLLRRPKIVWLTIASALLFTLAGFIKHNLVVLPIAMAIWLFICHRRGAIIFALCGTGFFILGLCSFRLIYGAGLLDQLFSSRNYAFVNLVTSLSDWISWAALPIGIAIWLFWHRPKERYVQLCTLYALAAFIAGAFFSGGDGVDANAMFDADIAICLCLALALKYAASKQAQTVIALLGAVPICLGLWQAADGDALGADYWLHPLRADSSQAQSDIAFLASHKGPALCEMLSLCYWAGKESPIDVFNIGEQFHTGTRSDAALIHLIKKHAFGVVQLDSLEPFSLTPSVKKALVADYRIQHSNDEGVFLIPR